MTKKKARRNTGCAASFMEGSQKPDPRGNGEKNWNSRQIRRTRKKDDSKAPLSRAVDMFCRGVVALTCGRIEWSRLNSPVMVVQVCVISVWRL